MKSEAIATAQISSAEHREVARWWLESSGVADSVVLWSRNGMRYLADVTHIEFDGDGRVAIRAVNNRKIDG